MSKFFVIVKREYAQIVKKKSFLVGVLLTPVLMIALMLLPAMLATKEMTRPERLAIIDRGEHEVGRKFAEALEKYKIQDTEQPAYIIRENLQIGPSDKERFQHVLDSLTGEVTEQRLRYMLVINPGAHLCDTNIYLVTNSQNFRTLSRFEYQLSQVLSTLRLSETDINLPVDSVLALTGRIDLKLKDTKGESIPFMVKYFGAIIFVMILYFMVVMNGQTLMRSVIDEKNSRIMEVLISSVTPFQLMAGKVMGMGAAAFTQVAIWFAVGLGIFFYTGSTSLELDPSISRIAFDPAIVTFFLLFFITGYIMYSTLFALIGSIVNSDKEAHGFVLPVSLSLILPLVVGMAVVQDPHATWVMAMAYFPLFTPTMMLMRVVFVAPTAVEYSLFSGIVGEAALGFIVVVLATIVIVWFAARIFRIGILMYGKRPTLPEIARWVRY
jgi:ABC-2 type transport system permease protein